MSLARVELMLLHLFEQKKADFYHGILYMLFPLLSARLKYPSLDSSKIPRLIILQAPGTFVLKTEFSAARKQSRDRSEKICQAIIKKKELVCVCWLIDRFDLWKRHNSPPPFLHVSLKISIEKQEPIFGHALNFTQPRVVLRRRGEASLFSPTSRRINIDMCHLNGTARRTMTCLCARWRLHAWHWTHVAARNWREKVRRPPPLPAAHRPIAVNVATLSRVPRDPRISYKWEDREEWENKICRVSLWIIFLLLIVIK